jgi:hypothetical protein
LINIVNPHTFKFGQTVPEGQSQLFYLSLRHPSGKPEVFMGVTGRNYTHTLQP